MEGLRRFFERRHDRIIEDWRTSTGEDAEMQRAHHLTRSQFLDHIPQVLELLDEYLGAPEVDHGYFEKQTSLHGHRRWKQGFSLEELIYDWGHLRAVLLLLTDEYFTENRHIDPEGRRACLVQMAKFTDRAIGASVREFDHVRRSEAASLEADLLAVREESEGLLRLRAELLHNVTHDLRGSLSGVTGASAVIGQLVEGGQDADRARAILARSVDNVRKMLDDLLDLARLEAGREGVELESLKPCTIAREVVDSFRAAAERKGLELHLDCPEQLRVSSDASALRRIVQNLVHNGIEYTREGAVTVTIRVEGDKHWKLEVADTGPGIQKSKGVPLAFQLDKPHSSRDEAHPTADPPSENYQGEGIGLTIVKRLCGLLHANIRFDSEPDEGSVFTILFPLENPSAEDGENAGHGAG